jgi:indole-3-acetate monooxygenase
MSSPRRVMTTAGPVGDAAAMAIETTEPRTDTIERRSSEREELMAAVDRVSEMILANAARAEEERTLPRANVEAMRAERLFAMAAPAAVGGLEVDPLTQMEIVEAVSYLDTSSGWTLMIGSHGAQMIATSASDEACDRVFGGDRWPISGSQISPFGGLFEVVPGGYKVSGHWTFASGIRHAEWSMLTASEIGDDGADGSPRQIAAVVPKEEVTVIDNWHVAGLKGTGSCDYSLEDRFVPEEMTWSFPPELRRGGPRYRMKTPQAMLAAFALGASRRSLEEIALQARAKMRPGSKSSVAMRPAFHKELGEAEMALKAARAVLFTIVGEMWDLLRTGEEVGEELSLRLTTAPAYVYDVSRQVVTTALRYGGSSALYLDNVLQRNYRDIAAGGQHIQASEQNYEVLGRWLVGVDQDSSG